MKSEAEVNMLLQSGGHDSRLLHKMGPRHFGRIRNRKMKATKKPGMAAGQHDGSGFAVLGSGAEGDRTPDLMTASHALSHLSYSPVTVSDNR